jgi:hypothetical protein
MPDADELTAKLVAASNSPIYQEGLYPLICDRLAGEQCDALNIILEVQLAIDDYTKLLTPTLASLFKRRMTMKLIEAVTPDKLRQEVRDKWAAIQARAETRSQPQ